MNKTISIIQAEVSCLNLRIWKAWLWLPTKAMIRRLALLITKGPIGQRLQTVITEITYAALTVRNLDIHGKNVENFMVSQLHLAKSGVNNQSMSRLNRFLVNEGWDYHFSGSIQCVFLRPVFDHFPVLLDGGGMRRGPSPFRFENMWLKVEGFKDLLKLKWGGNLSGSSSFILAATLKAFKWTIRMIRKRLAPCLWRRWKQGKK